MVSNSTRLLKSLAHLAVVVAAVIVTSDAQNWSRYYNGGNGGSNTPNSSDTDGEDGDNDSGSDFGRGSGFDRFDISSNSTKLTAHAVLATLAFAFFFPVGGILIRLGNFRGIWLVHALFQLFAYALYVAGAALGIYMIRAGPDMLFSDPHPIIGLVLLGLLFFQPFLGLIHHFLFKRYSRRTFWSHAHLWFGRIAITLGIINGGLGLRLARRYPLGPPSRAAVIGYSAASGFMWLLYVFCTILGERKRSTVRETKKEKSVVRKEVETASKSSSRMEYS